MFASERVGVAGRVGLAGLGTLYCVVGLAAAAGETAAPAPAAVAAAHAGPASLVEAAADLSSTRGRIVGVASTRAEPTERSPGGALLGPGTFCSDFEPPCFIGYVGGGGSGQPQNCVWRTSTAALPGYSQPRITDASPLAGLQHLRFQYDSAQPEGNPDQAADPGSRNWAFSDDIVPTPAPGVVNLRLSVNVGSLGQSGDNTLIIQPQSPSTMQLTTVMHLNANGTIFVGDDDTPGDPNFVIVDTGFTWTPGQYVEVNICVDTVANRIRYFYGGDLVWSTAASEGGLGGGVFAGPVIEHVLVRWEANQNDGRVADVDEVCIEPDMCLEPSGACCNFDGAGGCMEMSPDACAATGTGLYGGTNTACSVGLCAAIETCAGATGDCFDPMGNGTPGCSFPACCTIVCTEIPECCTIEWDFLCAELANLLCGAAPLCEQDPGSCQAFTNVNASTSVPGAFRVADNFSPVADGAIDQLCWNGAYLPNDPNPTDGFTVRYFRCVNGVPGANAIATFTQASGQLAVNGKQDTGEDIGVLADIYEYTATHPPVPLFGGQAYFIEITNAPSGGATWFWQQSVDPNGDGISFQRPDAAPAPAYARYHRQATDVAFCVNLDLQDPTGLCDPPPPAPCDLNVAGADVEENEACGADPDLNAGCTTPQPGPHAFTDVPAISTNSAVPTRVHGVSRADGGSRDIDWFRFTLPPGVDMNADGSVVVCLECLSELPMHAVLVTDDLTDGECGDTDIAATDAVGFDCEPLLAVGYTVDDQSVQYILARSADGIELFEGAPCLGPGLGNDYLLRIAVVDSFADCFAPPPACVWDLDGDGSVGFSDLLDVLTNWGPCVGPCPQDFDNDDNVGFADLLQVLTNWGPCT